MKLLTNLLFEPKGMHNPALTYSIKDTVMNADGSQVYFALQDVPAGIALNDERYWKLQIDLSGSKHAIDEAVANFSDYARIVGTRVRGETAKATGNPVTFLPDAGSLLMPVTVLEPQQEGSGDPSPSNIRPIIGYDALELNQVGKNLIGDWAQGAVSSKGEEFSSSTVIRSAITKIDEKNVYVTVPESLGYFLIEYADGVFLTRTDRNTSQAFTLRDNTTHIRLCLVRNDGSNITPTEAVGYQVEYGSVGTEVKPYQGKTHTVQIDRTVYGFRYEWLTGELTKVWRTVTLRDLSMRYIGGDHDYFEITMPSDALASGDFACESYKNVGQLFYSAMPTTPTGSMGYYAPERMWRLKDTRYKSVEELFAGNGDMKIVYKLVTPIESQLTPHIISAVEPEQTNTLYGDGSIEVEHVKPLHVSIEERVAAALAAAMNTEGE